VLPIPTIGAVLEFIAGKRSRGPSAVLAALFDDGVPVGDFKNFVTVRSHYDSVLFDYLSMAQLRNQL
jgi:hypothetical protein